MKFAPETDIEIKEEVEIDVEQVKLYTIVVFNDDVNKFQRENGHLFFFSFLFEDIELNTNFIGKLLPYSK